MKNKNYPLLLLMLLLFATISANAGNQNPVYGYTENKGQVHDQNGNARDDIKFMYVDETFKLILRNDGFSYEWLRSNYMKNNNPESGIVEIADDEEGVQDYPVQFINNRVDINFVNANKNISIVSEGVSNYYSNYFNNYTGSEGIKRVRNYETITYKNVYDGIDLVFTSTKGNDGKIYPEYRFVVHPNGNMGEIALSYNGADKLSVVKDGSLQLNVPLGMANETKPLILFADGSASREGNFIQHGNIISFQKVKRSEGQTFTIDPTIVWGTYWGGTQKDLTDEITTDANGNCLVTGRVRSNTLFATAGAYQTVNNGNLDIPLMKWAPDGNLVYATYYGGQANEIGFCITVDPAQNIWIGGHTFSASGIATADAMQPYFVPGAEDDYDGNLSKFTSEGFLVYGTYFGGVGQDELQNIWADADGSIYASGFAEALDHIIYSPCFDCTGDTSGAIIIMKFNNSGQQVWANYWAGSQRDRGHGVTTYGNNVYQCGTVLSKDDVDYGSPSGNAYQVSNAGLNDMFLARWNKTTGEPIWITYFGGTGDERGRDVRCDRDGYIYFTGQTESGFDGLATAGAWKTSFVYSPSNRDGIVAKFDSNCNKIWATYFGGNDIDFPRSLRVMPEGAPIYIGGYTKSDSDFVTSLAFDKKNKKNNDAFWMRFNWDGSVLQYSTYFGGKKSESVTEPGWYGPTMDLDANNNVFISSGTNSTDGIAYGNSFKDTLQGTDQYDFFVAKFADPCPDGFEPNDAIEQASKLYFRGTNSITRTAPLQEKGDKDYFTFATSGDQSNIKVELTNLPLDYNMFLYDNNGVQIGKSKELGTANEVIVVNNTYIGKYSILVKGSSSSVYQDGACYTLSVSASDSPFRLTDETSVSAAGTATIYPNPSNNSAELNFTAKLDGNYQIDISNLEGRIISSIKQHFNVGDQSVMLPVDQLASGNYLVKISGSGLNEVLKLVVSK